MEIKIDIHFDSLRRSGANAYNNLAKQLNSHIDKDSIRNLEIEDIFKKMDRLREFVGTVLCLQDEEKGIKALDINLIEFAPDYIN